MKLGRAGAVFDLLTQVQCRPHMLLKSTALLEPLLADLAVEVGVLPGPAAIHPSGTGRHLPRQVPLALKFLLADSAGEHDVTVYLACMHLQLHLALE